MKNLISLLIFFLLAQGIIYSFQTNEDGLTILKSKKGFLFVFNDSLESFKIEIEGNKLIDIEPEELIFSIDNQIFQFTIVPISAFFSPYSNVDTLMQHFNFEMKYLVKELGINIPDFKPNKIMLPNGKYALFWEFEPILSKKDTSNETVIRHIFASIKTNRFVVLISSPLTKSNNFKTAKGKIQNALLTFDFIPFCYNLDELRKSLTRKKD